VPTTGIKNLLLTGSPGRGKTAVLGRPRGESHHGFGRGQSVEVGRQIRISVMLEHPGDLSGHAPGQ
jgi:hypothetical protein